MANQLLNRCMFRAASGGTGSFVVSGAVSGYMTPALADAVNSTVYSYIAESDDRTQWEIGTGTYTSGTTTLTRTPLKSSNANAAVNFSAAPKVSITALASDLHMATAIHAATAKPAVVDADEFGIWDSVTGLLNRLSWSALKARLVAQGAVREALTANRTYYVRFDGVDTNNGLTNTAGGAFLTISAAVDAALALDPSIYSVTIQLQDGTWTSGPSMGRPMLGSSTLIFKGNEGTPANCILAGGTSITATGTGVSMSISGVSINGSLLGINCVNGAAIALSAGIIFGGDPTSAHMRVNGIGSTININTNYSIVSGGARHIQASPAGYVNIFNKTITLVGTLNFSGSFAFADRMALVSTNSSTFTGGTVTGKRYDIQTNSVIYTGGGGASHFPGNVAGTVATGGQYQ